MMNRADVLERLTCAANTDPVTGCWLWQLGKTSAGYGQITIDKSVVYAHRASFAAFKGDIPDGMEVCHTCDNPSCINPTHLFLGSHRENMTDAARKGRMGGPSGEKSGAAKLTVAQVREIRKSEGSHRKLAAIYGVSHRTIGYIKNYKIWREA